MQVPRDALVPDDVIEGFHRHPTRSSHDCKEPDRIWFSIQGTFFELPFSQLPEIDVGNQ